MRPSTEIGSRYAETFVSPNRTATSFMCQYETQAAMPAMVAVATTRTDASSGLCMGIREVSSTVSSSANGGQAEMVWLIGFVPQLSGFTLKLTTQRGYLQGYSVTMILGVVIILLVVFL